MTSLVVAIASLGCGLLIQAVGLFLLSIRVRRLEARRGGRMSTDTDTLADRIRSEAVTTSRPGQMESLEQIADEVEHLAREAARIRDLAREHMNCTGCPTPWWLKQAPGEGP